MICNIKFIIALSCMYEWQQKTGILLIAPVDNDTGELIGKKNGRKTTYTYRGTHKNLKLKVLHICLLNLNYEEVNRYILIVSGSLHKYFQNGTNWRRFRARDVDEAIKKLCNELDLDPNICKLQNLEVGLNLPVSFDPNSFINSCLLTYAVTQFIPYQVDKNGVSIGCVARQSQLAIKVYNKAQQSNVSIFIMRVEIQYKKMQPLAALGIATLSDLTDVVKLKKLAARISQAWGKVLCIEDSVPYQTIQIPENQKNILLLGRSSSYWTNLHSSNPKAYFKKRTLFRTIQNKYAPINYHVIIEKTISEELIKAFEADGYEFTTWIKCKSDPIQLIDTPKKTSDNLDEPTPSDPETIHTSDSQPIQIRSPSSIMNPIYNLHAMVSRCFLKFKKIFRLD